MQQQQQQQQYWQVRIDVWFLHIAAFGIQSSYRAHCRRAYVKIYGCSWTDRSGFVLAKVSRHVVSFSALQLWHQSETRISWVKFSGSSERVDDNNMKLECPQAMHTSVPSTSFIDFFHKKRFQLSREDKKMFAYEKSVLSIFESEIIWNTLCNIICICFFNWRPWFLLFIVHKLVWLCLWRNTCLRAVGGCGCADIS